MAWRSQVRYIGSSSRGGGAFADAMVTGAGDEAPSKVSGQSIEMLPRTVTSLRFEVMMRKSVGILKSFLDVGGK